MSNHYDDRDTYINDWVDGSGFGWFLLFFFLAAPFLLLAIWLWKYAEFVIDHKVFCSGVFLVISILISCLLYGRSKVEHKLFGIVAIFASLMPIWIAQLFYAVPFILSNDNAFEVTVEWLLVTLITVGITFFVDLIGIMYENGLKHLALSAVYLIVALVIIL